VDRDFDWDPYADQPHNVAPRKERFWYHFRFASGYLSLVSANIRNAIPVLSLYRDYKRKMYKDRVRIRNPFGVSVSPVRGRQGDAMESLTELGIRKTLVRIPSWEKEKIASYLEFIEKLRARGFEVVIALLQCRQDVQNPREWWNFLEEVFTRFKHVSSFFEVGHAWNRTKWGVWDYREYLQLAEASRLSAEKHGVKIIGPAVIDFEFHLYPAVLKKTAFEKITSLLYVDRLGAPENTQFGWDTSHKVALLKSVVDGCLKESRDVWITEMNWPLQGRGKYSPAAGKVNVSEEEQANFLVRYFVLVLASGMVERVYWWQLAAPGYGLIDNLDDEWRKRPAFFALKCMVGRLKNSIFIEKIPHPGVYIFLFRNERGLWAVCWTKNRLVEPIFSRRILRAEDREGREVALTEGRIQIGPSPLYVYFDENNEP
jgi:hypothetical protein